MERGTSLLGPCAPAQLSAYDLLTDGRDGDVVGHQCKVSCAYANGDVWQRATTHTWAAPNCHHKGGIDAVRTRHRHSSNAGTVARCQSQGSPGSGGASWRGDCEHRVSGAPETGQCSAACDGTAHDSCG